MKINYEKAMEELQQIVGQLQEDSLSVDELSAKVKRAAELIALCREKLRKTEEDLEGLFED
ncbi:MAG: exodeoxyribonuclease VII small subunit [Phaeodactylibacter sp.]|nr:exodeoxyribonuclease VII small subunit [Phaeodactylibacter sp.]MCB9303753.1 exodeoxyribonuclease VII small subunit [Lewinellaceae bacterium]HQU60984.1 exodeoxyribonuclease VII small subunit [Saprospiraceae bacterium]